MRRYANGGACTDMVHAETEGRAVGALEERSMCGGHRDAPPNARHVAQATKAVATGTGDRMRMFGQENQRLKTASFASGVHRLTSTIPITTAARQTRP